VRASVVRVVFERACAFLFVLLLLLFLQFSFALPGGVGGMARKVCLAGAVGLWFKGCEALPRLKGCGVLPLRVPGETPARPPWQCCPCSLGPTWPWLTGGAVSGAVVTANSGRALQGNPRETLSGGMGLGDCSCQFSFALRGAQYGEPLEGPPEGGDRALRSCTRVERPSAPLPVRAASTVSPTRGHPRPEPEEDPAGLTSSLMPPRARSPRR